MPTALRDPRLTLLLRFRAGAAIACLFIAVAGNLGGLGLKATVAFVCASLSVLVSNLVAARSLVGKGARVRAGALVTLDALLLTLILGTTGGATNPFATLYLVVIALSAALLGPRWCWSMAVLSTLLYASLFTLEGGTHSHEATAMGSHLQGMWFAFVLSAALVAGFSSRLASLSEKQQADLKHAEEGRQRAEKLAALTSFATDAVHELSTPLTTLAVVAGEIERDAGRGRPPKAADIALVHSEVRRCSEILDAISGRAQGSGPIGQPCTLEDVVNACVNRLPDQRRRRVATDLSVAFGLSGSREAIERALANVLSNALDAAPDSSVRVRDGLEEQGVVLVVEDDGPGMTEDILRRVGEPFFSTKERHRGLGLGLFSARSLITQIGGTLELSARKGGGTEARLWIPRTA